MRVTIRDIAQAVGCSTTAVSLVMNGKGKSISAQTADAIQEAAKRLNYHPNKLASHLVTKKSNIIGLIQPDNCNLFFASVLKCVEQQADQLGYRVICGNSNNSSKRDCDYINTFISYCVDGILIVKSDSSSKEDSLRLKELIRSVPVPVVAIDRKISDVPVPTYTVDNCMGGYLATKYLLQQGHRRIGYYTYPLRVYTAAERLRGYRTALEEYGVAYDPALVLELDSTDAFGGGDFSSREAQVQAYLRGDITAVFAHNDTLAYELYKYAQRGGIRIPEDISITGFDNLSFSPIITPALTTVHQPFTEIVDGAIHRLIHAIEAGAANAEPADEICYEPWLIERDSVRRL